MTIQRVTVSVAHNLIWSKGVQASPGHRVVRNLKHSRLVHIVPYVHPGVAPNKVLSRLLRRYLPTIDLLHQPGHLGVEVVVPGGIFRPTRSAKVASITIFHEKGLLVTFLLQKVVIFARTVRINNRNQTSFAFFDLFQHCAWVWERFKVPGEILLFARILNIEPNAVAGDLVCYQLLVHLQILRLTHIVPATLVIAQRPHWRLEGGPKESLLCFG